MLAAFNIFRSIGSLFPIIHTDVAPVPYVSDDLTFFYLTLFMIFLNFV